MSADPEPKSKQAERHLTGQELCEAIRRYALEEYRLHGQVGAGQLGPDKTRDFGNIVFNLIEVERMKKTKRRPDRGF